MKTLYSERLQLRGWSSDDVDFVFDMYSRWEVQQYLGTTPRVMTERAEAEAAIDRFRTRGDHPVFGVWAIARNTDNQLVGVGLLKPIPLAANQPDSPEEVEVGWHLHPDAWGRGYAAEAGARLLQHAFDSGLPAVVAVTNPANTASRAVALRIGMTDRGLTDRYYNTTCELFTAERGT